MSAPQVLLVTSAGASPAAVTPVLAALEASEMRVRAIDVGRAGSQSEGAVERVLRAVVGELSERRLSKELGSNPPDVVVAFDPSTTQTLTVARDAASKPAPVVAVIDDLSPGKRWAATDADRYLVVDDEAAVALADHGVEADRIVTVGPLCSQPYAAAGVASRDALRGRFKIGGGPVVVVEVAGLGFDMTSQVALQLSLAQAEPVYLFDAGHDNEAATALRRSVPTLGMKAKLFGATADSPLYWRCADVVIARPSARAVAHAMVVGARLVSFAPNDQAATDRARAVEERKLGAQAPNALLLSSALEPLLGLPGRSDALLGADGAGNVADAVWILGEERNAVIDERLRSSVAETRARVKAATTAAERAARATAPAGGLEDLSGGGASVDWAAAQANVPDVGELQRLRAELDTRRGQVAKTVFSARETAEKWDGRILAATRDGDEELARQAEKNADLERARMHKALAELSEIEAEIKALDRAETQARAAAAARPPSPPPGFDATPPPRRPSGPSVDDLLDRMKRDASGGTSSAAPADKPRRRKKRKKSSVDAELEALKRKMAADKGKKS